jgi:hypothetical protein
MTDEEYSKAIGQFRLQLNGVFTPFHAYGMEVYVPGAAESVLKLAIQLHHRLSGLEVPISLDADYGNLPDD